jgi:hypothetical protein
MATAPYRWTSGRARGALVVGLPAAYVPPRLGTLRGGDFVRGLAALAWGPPGPLPPRPSASAWAPRRISAGPGRRRVVTASVPWPGLEGIGLTRHVAGRGPSRASPSAPPEWRPGPDGAAPRARRAHGHAYLSLLAHLVRMGLVNAGPVPPGATPLGARWRAHRGARRRARLHAVRRHGPVGRTWRRCSR